MEKAVYNNFLQLVNMPNVFIYVWLCKLESYLQLYSLTLKTKMCQSVMPHTYKQTPHHWIQKALMLQNKHGWTVKHALINCRSKDKNHHVLDCILIDNDNRSFNKGTLPCTQEIKLCP